MNLVIGDQETIWGSEVVQYKRLSTTIWQCCNRYLLLVILYLIHVVAVYLILAHLQLEP